MNSIYNINVAIVVILNCFDDQKNRPGFYYMDNLYAFSHSEPHNFYVRWEDQYITQVDKTRKTMKTKEKRSVQLSLLTLLHNQ